MALSQFQEATPESLARQLETMFKQGPIKGLVLDLRNDPGGLLYGAVAISAAFLPAKALVVSTDGRTEDARKKFYATNEDYLRGVKDDMMKNLPPAVKTVPMVVLVNGGSASASEIVAGALQDNKRATVIGTQTFGKGSVQTIMPLGNNTAIKLTTARYFTPSGRSIQAKGITPDVIVEEPGATLAARIREADLQRHLDNSQDKNAGKETPKPATPTPSAAAAAASEPPKPIELGSKEDFQLQQALAYLRANRSRASRPPSHRPSRLRKRRTDFRAGFYNLDDQQLLRYSRHILLDEVGIEGQEQLRAAHALIVGAGGLGCPAALLPRRQRHWQTDDRRSGRGRSHQPAAADSLPHGFGRRAESGSRARRFVGVESGCADFSPAKEDRGG